MKRRLKTRSIPVATMGCCALVAGAALQAAGQPVLGTRSYYEFVEADVTWHEARASAASRSLHGQSGYLATLLSGRENSFVLANFFQDRPAWMAWMGGYEPVENELWLWADGPEAGQQMSLGEHPVPPNFYANWGGLEPTDSGGVGHDYAAINLGRPFAGIDSGEWTAGVAGPSASNPVRGYLVEYPLPPKVSEPASAAALAAGSAWYCAYGLRRRNTSRLRV